LAKILWSERDLKDETFIVNGQYLLPSGSIVIVHSRSRTIVYCSYVSSALAEWASRVSFDVEWMVRYAKRV